MGKRIYRKTNYQMGFSLPETLIMLIVVTIMIAGGTNWFASLSTQTALMQNRSLAQAQLGPILESNMTDTNLAALIFSGATPTANPTTFGDFSVGNPITYSGGSPTVTSITATITFGDLIAKNESPDFLKSVYWAFLNQPAGFCSNAWATVVGPSPSATPLPTAPVPNTAPVGPIASTLEMVVNLDQNGRTLSVKSKAIEAVVVNPDDRLHPSVAVVGSNGVGTARACRRIGAPVGCNLSVAQTNSILSNLCSGNRVPGHVYTAPINANSIGTCSLIASPSPSPTATPCTMDADCGLGEVCGQTTNTCISSNCQAGTTLDLVNESCRCDSSCDALGGSCLSSTVCQIP